MFDEIQKENACVTFPAGLGQVARLVFARVAEDGSTTRRNHAHRFAGVLSPGA